MKKEKLARLHFHLFNRLDTYTQLQSFFVIFSLFYLSKSDDDWGKNGWGERERNARRGVEGYLQFYIFIYVE